MRQMREANLASMPLDLSSSSEIVNKEHSLLSTFAGLQTGNKDWPPTDDAKTCTPLKTKAQLTLWINRARSYHYKKRLECFTEFGVGEKLLKPETTMAQKPDLSSGKKNNQNPAGSTTPQSETGSANLNTATHGSSSVDEKLPKPETLVAQKPDSSYGTRIVFCERNNQNPAGPTTPLSETRGSSCETVSLALFPSLTGEKQSKKQMRNTHILAPKKHE
ncbi:hypothetical protein YC2023_121172 [Brassica napus]